MSAILLLSGGLDSGTLLAKLCHDKIDVSALSINYGQKHNDAERDAAWKLTDFFEIPLETLLLKDIFSFRHMGALLSTTPMPHLSYQELAEEVGPSPTYVPFRNAVLISAAVSIALQIEADSVYIATHAEDARNWAYPDCTPEFNGSMAAAVYVGTYSKARLFTPFQWMMKRDIVKLGHELNAPFHLMWSCYEGDLTPCRKCPTCIERAEAFRANGLKDPM